jgi:hypothetical protein
MSRCGDSSSSPLCYEQAPQEGPEAEFPYSLEKEGFEVRGQATTQEPSLTSRCLYPRHIIRLLSFSLGVCLPDSGVGPCQWVSMQKLLIFSSARGKTTAPGNNAASEKKKKNHGTQENPEGRVSLEELSRSC